LVPYESFLLRFFVDWFQKLVKDSKRKMEVYADFYVWDVCWLFFALAQTEIDSSVSSILNSLTPLNTLILGALVFGVSFERRQIWGVLLDFVGSYLVFKWSNDPDQITIIY
jgi:multidrug transporter EmrE-like cation transporter